jgi:hypothetical protein
VSGTEKIAGSTRVINNRRRSNPNLPMMQPFQCCDQADLSQTCDTPAIISYVAHELVENDRTHPQEVHVMG